MRSETLTLKPIPSIMCRSKGHTDRPSSDFIENGRDKEREGRSVYKNLGL